MNMTRMKQILIRILLFVPGLLTGLFQAGKDSARDIHNCLRFRARVGRGSTLNAGTRLAPHVRIYPGCVVNDTVVGDWTYLARRCEVKNATIGRYCSIGSEVIIGPGRHPVDRFSTSPVFYSPSSPCGSYVDGPAFEEYLPVTIGNDVWIGSRAIVLDGVRIGDGAIIGAGAIVTRDIPAGAVAVGAPAKVISQRSAWEKGPKGWYDQDPEEVLKELKKL